jgi:membrane-bound lytic murein transglycosylase D
MKKFYTLKLLVLCLFSVSLFATKVVNDDAAILERLKNMHCLVDANNPQAIAHIKQRLNQKSKTEYILGKSATFFSIFDQELKNAGMPTDLKYLAVIESGLASKVFSPKGAGGLWQFMPGTASMYGMQINSSVDERSDPVKSTQAAIKYIKKLYDIFDNWDLVFASYNSGPATVANAMKRAKSKDFDRIKKFLPEETNKYMPAFIAANYIFNYFKLHDLKPKMLELDMQNVVAMKVYNSISLAKIAEVTLLDYSLIKELNASYLDDYISGSKESNYVIVPRRCSNALTEFISNADKEGERDLKFIPIAINGDMPPFENDLNYFKTTYTVSEGEKLEDIADIFNCSMHNISLWSGLNGSYIYKGLELIIFQPRVIPGKKA